MISILNDFLTNRRQGVVLNDQCSSWVNILAGALQSSILGSLLFLIYVNDIPNGLKSKRKLFAGDTSLFSVAHDVNTSSSDINSDLKLISDWAFQWKMSFDPDPSKQTQEIIFGRKKIKPSYPSVIAIIFQLVQLRCTNILECYSIIHEVPNIISSLY